MEASPVDLVTRAYAAWNAGDWPALAAIADRDFEMRPTLGVPEDTVFFGVEGLKAFREAAEGLLGRLSAEPLEVLRADDEHVLVLSHVRGRGAESGVEIDQHFVYAWTIRDGRIAAMQSFASEGDAVAAIGGEPPAPPPTPQGPARGAPPSRGEAARARPGA
jgi:ketosteroid isomerase-like protein